MRQLVITTLAFLASTFHAMAWDVKLEEEAFGQRDGIATSEFRNGGSMFVECQQGKLAFGLITLEKNDDGNSGTITFRLAIDGAQHKDYDVEIGSTRAETYRMTSDSPEESLEVLKAIAVAKKRIETALVGADGSLIYTAKREVSGSSRAMHAIAKACKLTLEERSKQ